MSEFDELLADLKLNPDKLLDKTLLSDDDILRVAKALNPYSTFNSAEETEVKRVALISHTNMGEEYMKRFLMTSMVGFVYKMMEEYEPPQENLVWSLEDAGSTDKLHKETTKPFTYNKLVYLQNALNTVLPPLKSVEERLQQLNHKRTVCAIDDIQLSKEDEDEDSSLRKEQAALLFGVTRTLLESGRDAERRFDETVELCKPYEDVMAEVNKNPVRIRNENERSIPLVVAKRLVKDFMDSYFEYNPDEHVRSAMDTAELEKSMQKETVKELRRGMDSVDVYRPSLKLMRCRVDLADHLDQSSPEFRNATKILSSRESYNAFMHILNDMELTSVAPCVFADPESYRYLLLPLQKAYELGDYIPPQDTFHRWGYYSEVNMEEIRNIVHCMYHDKPEFDEALIIYDVIEGTQEEIDERRKEFVVKHGEEVISDIKEVGIGKWVVMANYKDNRKKIDFINRHTEVLKRIFDRYEEDKKMGKEIMKKRVRKAKAKNIKEEGPEAEIMKEYRGYVKDISLLGAERALTSEELRVLEDAKGYLRSVEEVKDVPEDSVQVNVFEYNARENTLVKSAIYTEAEKPEEKKH